MTADQVEAWMKQRGCTGKETYRANGIDYLFAVLPDKWVAVFENRAGDYSPVIQAADIEHARTHCNLTEPLPFGAQII